MNHEFPASIDSLQDPRDLLWVTSQFSTKELHRDHVRINWLRKGSAISWGIYEIQMTSFGHSRHIQNIHVVPVEGCGCGEAAFDLDQTDADLLRRTNASPREYSFVANLDRDRVREQNALLERLVHERRLRKMKDVEGADHWESVVAPVVKPIVVQTEPCPLSEFLDTERHVLN
jgi:hypothetical protein